MQTKLVVLRQLKQRTIYAVVGITVLLALTACNRTLEIGIADTQTPTPAAHTPTTAASATSAPPTTTPAPPASPTQSPTNTVRPTQQATSTPVPAAPTATPAPATTPEAYERRDTAVGLLASYYNAIEREEYRRAYNHWETPQQSFDEFAGGFSDTAAVAPIVEIPPYLEATAGNRYAAIPTLLVASHDDGSRQTFVGCFVAHRAAPGVAGHPTDWFLRSAQIAAHSGGAGVSLITGACESHQRSMEAIAYDQRIGPITLLASYYNAIERGEYRRAYDYWKQPAQSYEEFAQGFATTESVQVYVALTEGAGTVPASVPTLLHVTERDGSRQYYIGCFTMEPSANQSNEWSLLNATLASTDTGDVTPLIRTCA